jgi:fatty acid desaturase
MSGTPQPSAPPRRTGRAGLGYALTGVFAALNGALYFVLPVAAQTHPTAAGVAALAVAALTVSYWAVIHEAFHGALHPDRRVNDRLGRLLCILFGAAFAFLRYGHLIHHRFNRGPGDQSELYDARTTHPLVAKAYYYARLTVGLYAVEVIGNILALLPKRLLRPAVHVIFLNNDARAGASGAQAVRVLVDGPLLRDIRVDSVLALSAMAAAFWLWGAHWPWLAAALLMRGFFISFMDNAFHYGTPLNDSKAAYNLKPPAGLGPLLLNFNLHRVHHANPNLPWYALPAAFESAGESYDGGYIRTAARQWRGPVPRPEPPPETPTAPAAAS